MLDDEVSSTLKSSATRLVSWAKFSSGNYSTAPSPPYWATCSWLTGVGILGWYSQVSKLEVKQICWARKDITINTIIDMRLRVLSCMYIVAFARCLYLFKFEIISHFWLWSVCSCWGYKGKNPRVAYHFQPMYVPHIMGYDHPMPSLPTKVSGLRRGRVAKGGNFLLFEVVLPLMGWCPLWCAMVVLPVMAAINFNQNTLEREKSGLGSYMFCGCTCKSYHSRSIWQCPPIKCTIHISVRNFGLKVAKSVLVSSQSQWAPLDVSSCQWSV